MVINNYFVRVSYSRPVPQLDVTDFILVQFMVFLGVVFEYTGD